MNGSAQARARLMAILAVVGLLVGVGSASAATPAPILGSPPPLAPGDAAVAQGFVTKHSFCRLTLRSGKRSVSSGTAKATQRQVQFTWKVPANAAARTWKARIGCATTRSKATKSPRFSAVRSIKVLQGKRTTPGTGAIAAKGSIRMISVKPDPRLGLGAGGVHWPGYGATLVAGSGWQVPGAAGRSCGGGVTWPCGVDVKSNNWANWPWSPSNAIGQFGSYNWQCVELIERFMNLVGWYHGVIPAGGGVASGMYASAPATTFDKHPNGSGYKPVPGDVIVYSGGDAGHVAIVEWDDGTHVGVLEQNVKFENGRGTETFTGNTLKSHLNGLSVIGFLHAKANTVNPPPPPGYHVTSDGVAAHAAPSTQSPVVRQLNRDVTLNIACQRRSDSVVKGSSIWDRLNDGSYVADADVNTPAFNQFSPGIAQCPAATARGLALRSNGSGYVLDAYGGLHPVNGAPDVGSAPIWPDWDIARAVALRPSSSGGYLLDGWGGIHPFGGAPAVSGGPYWQGWDIARDIALRPDGTSGYVLDGWGGIDPFGGAPAVSGGPYWKGWDIARALALRSDGTSGYVLDGWGGVHNFGGAPAVTGSAYWQGWDIARDIALRPDGTSGYVLDGWGGIHPFGGAPALAASRYTQNVDDARRLVLTADGNGGWVVFTDGRVAPFGDAPAVSTSWNP